MKKNSVTLALFLYPTKESQDRFLKQSSVYALVPSLTRGGKRSLLYHLEQEAVLFSERVSGDIQYSLTEKGQRQLIELFPALDSKWDTYAGTWQCIVFQQAPKSDPQFRYLRSQLVREHAIGLSRGVYCSPDSFSTNLIQMCQKLYQDCVSIFSVASWDFGFERSSITRNFSLADLATSYSSVSTEVESLLASVDQKRRPNDQEKKQFFSVYNRFRDILSEDVGITTYYYPQVPSGLQLLAQLQELADTF